MHTYTPWNQTSQGIVVHASHYAEYFVHWLCQATQKDNIMLVHMHIKHLLLAKHVINTTFQTVQPWDGHK